MSSSIDPLADLIRQFPIEWVIAVTILVLFCAWWVAFRRLAKMRTRIDVLRSDIGRLEGQYGGLLVRELNLPKPRSRKAPKRSNSSSDLLQEASSLVPEQPDKNDSGGSGLSDALTETDRRGAQAMRRQSFKMDPNIDLVKLEKKIRDPEVGR